MAQEIHVALILIKAIIIFIAIIVAGCTFSECVEFSLLAKGKPKWHDTEDAVTTDDAEGEPEGLEGEGYPGLEPGTHAEAAEGSEDKLFPVGGLR